MKIVDIRRNDRKEDVYDIETPTHDYILSNGIISHNTLEMFSKEVMGGGTGGIYASDTIFFIGKQQEKDGKELLGWNFIINIEKSRYVKEKEKLGVLVTYDAGINKFSGIFDLAVEFGIVGNPSKGYYSYPNTEDAKKVRRKDIEGDSAIMQEIVENSEFNQAVEDKYKLKMEDREEDEVDTK